MSNSEKVIQDMRLSMEMVQKHKDQIMDMLNGSEILTVEGDDNRVCKMLDTNCGTDYFLIAKCGNTYGVGSRFQFDQPDWPKYKTFTIRRSRESGAITEFEKRDLAIRQGATYPQLTLQGYVDKNSHTLDRMAIARTKDVIEFIKLNDAPVKGTGKDQIGKATFFYVDWDEFEKAGYQILRYTKKAS